MDTSRQSYVADVLKDKLRSFVSMISPIFGGREDHGNRKTGSIADAAAEDVDILTD